MAQKHDAKNLAWKLLTAIAICTIVFTIINFHLYGLRASVARDQLKTQVSGQISNRIDQDLFFSTVWKDIIVRDGGEVIDFEGTSARLVEDFANRAVESIQITTSDKVSYVYDVYGVGVIPIDLQDPALSKALAITAGSGAPSVSAPYVGADGAYRMSIVESVSLENGQSESAPWGYVVITLKMDDMLQRMGLDALGVQVDFKLSRVDDDGTRQLFCQFGPDALLNPVFHSFETPNGTWEFEASWKGGWVRLPEVLGETAGILVVCFLLFVIWNIRKKNKKLSTLSMHDELTGLNNRRCLRANFDDYYNRNAVVSAVLIDIDDFKIVNDTYGHAAGDQALKLLADALKNAFGTDKCYRYGGDEFLVICEKSSAEDMKARCSGLVSAVESKSGQNGSPPFTISGGFARRRCVMAADIRALISDADDLLYESKRRGKNTISGFERERGGRN